MHKKRCFAKTVSFSSVSKKQKLPKFRRYVNFTLTLNNRHGTHIQRYYFNQTDLIKQKFTQRLTDARKLQKMATTENVTTRYLSSFTEIDEKNLPNQFNSIFVIEIILITFFIFFIVIIFIFFMIYVKFYKIKILLKNAAVSEVYDARKASSMFPFNRNIDESLNNVYKKTGDNPLAPKALEDLEFVNDTILENFIRKKILLAKHTHSASPSSSFAFANLSNYVTQKQILSEVRYNHDLLQKQCREATQVHFI